MKLLKVKIIDQIGLHARPASIVVMEASKFESEITIEIKGRAGNLKSIMSVMALGIKWKDKVIIKASGSDEDKAITMIKTVMKENNLI